MEEQETSCAF